MNQKELAKIFMMPSNGQNPLISMVYTKNNSALNPFKPEFIIVIFIHYKPRIAVAILDL